jgi:hypothetical protein
MLRMSPLASGLDGNDVMRFDAPSTHIYAMGGAAHDDIITNGSPYNFIIGDYASAIIASSGLSSVGRVYNSLQGFTSISNAIGGNDLITVSQSIETVIIGGDGDDTITAMALHTIICGDYCDGLVAASVLSLKSTPLLSQLGGDDRLAFTGTDSTLVQFYDLTRFCIFLCSFSLIVMPCCCRVPQ